MKITTIPAPQPVTPPPTFVLELSQAELATIVAFLHVGAYVDTARLTDSTGWPCLVSFDQKQVLHHDLRAELFRNS